MAICLLLNDTVMWRYLNDTLLTYKVLIISMFIVCIFGIFSCNKAKLDKMWLGTLFLCIIFFLVYMLATRYNIITFTIYFFFVVLLFFTYCYNSIKLNRLKQLFEAYENIILIISVVTFLCWLMGSIWGILPGKTLLSYHWAGRTYNTYSYYYLYFENPVQNEQMLLGREFIRNCGIFTEVPGFSGILLYTLGIELFAHKGHCSKIKITILIATLISTFSTKGMLLLIIVLLVNYLTSYDRKQSKIHWAIRMTASVPLLVLGIYACTFILADKAQTGSYWVRMDDVVASVKTWLSAPVFGVGYNNYRQIASHFLLTRSSEGLSMGLTALLAQGGIYLFTFYFGAFICAIRCKALKQYKQEISMFSLIVFINLVISNNCFSMVMLMIICCGYATIAMQEKHKMKIN